MKHLDLFSGIGGFALAARWVGWETVAFCEPDPYCQAVLRKHWPDVPIHDDVRELTADATGPVDIVTGGYPCQPFSLAGKRSGAGDDRHLWPAMFELVRALRPAWVVGENVAGHVTMGLDDVLSDLEGIGYACRAFVIPAVAVDARHRRERVWVVAHAARDEQRRAQQRPEWERARARGQSELMADALSERQLQPRGPESHKRGRTGNSGPHVADADSAGQPDDQGRAATAELSGLGASDGRRGRAREHAAWLPEPDVGRVASRLSIGLDDCRGRLDEFAEALARAKGVSTDDAYVGCLRAMRQYGELAETSPQLRRPSGIRDSLSDVSRQVARRRTAGEPYEAMRDLWDEVSARSLEETQDLFKSVLIGAWKVQCDEALGTRVHRLRALGNAIVPQVAYEIFRAIGH